MRTYVGILAGIITFAGIAWFSADVIRGLGGSSGKISALSMMILMVFALLASLQVGSLLASGRWLEDDTFPKERSWMAMGAAIVLFILSIVSW
ncbi:MAG: hypothetical protein E5Y88_12275 [Mesorhizobium sp.]|uniref:hypothetical protein n=1 Tax=Mesorhizobium sp. TaxID=1871066 RepID=UPI0012250885|nr:hypothetical protein [Mesorhizobium sp.]TIL25718.1 MAG: hypothetical protein E5Y88_12275 [Mesorhizobium sp.]